MNEETGTENIASRKRSRAGKRRYRHKRTPCPQPRAGEATWLRGRRKSPGVLLALHHAAVLVRTGELTSHQLYRGAFYEACHSEKEPWLPKPEVFFRWLQHHRIARKVDRNVWVAGLSASAFALIPNRNRVRRIGTMILAREASTSGRSSRETRRSPMAPPECSTPEDCVRTLPFLDGVTLDFPIEEPV